MSRRAPPPLIALIASLQGLSALMCAGLAIGVASRWIRLDEALGLGPIRLAPFVQWGRLAALPALAAALFCAAFARGLWRRRPWARTLLIALLTLNVIGDVGILGLYAIPVNQWAVAVAAILKSTVAAALLWYLARPHVRAQFRDSGPPGKRMEGVAAILLTCLVACMPSGRVNQTPAPPLVLGRFTDDYGNRYHISDSAWVQLPHGRYRIALWKSADRYLVAQNDSANTHAPGKWTRIDWMAFEGMAPYTWGFCMTAYEAATWEAAEATPPAERSTPRTGCKGYPFSRMKPDTTA